ncbi:DNA/RNA non-specific endonuclease [Chitinivorax sp. B]|uniref:DNA/RNA non-specific endonuclease n=1 Tax=Chitinivorax sp. B TaxID=2502235 RepID=UPI0010F6A107|nr:DNA/RNA non-specific endonuclease [Chitinivorax sp. B]
MNLRKVATGLSALALIFAVALQARSLHDLIKLPVKHDKQEYRSGSVSQREALALYSAKQKQDSFSACKDQFPAGKPLDIDRMPAKMKPMALCSDNFAVLYSKTSKTPMIVVERLSSAQLNDAKGEERTNAFYADPRIPSGARAELSDYRGQTPPVDRGHQAPAADAPNQKAMAQSFALSNMVPQDPTNNRKIWSKIESDVRKYVKRAGGNVFVFTGPIFDSGHAVIGKNKVWVPTRLFKLVYDENSQRAWAYILPNSETRIEKPMDYSNFVKATGLRLLESQVVSGSLHRS